MQIQETDMTETILCLVGLFFMGWVVVLKLENNSLKGRSTLRKTGGAGRDGTAKGMRTFDIN